MTTTILTLPKEKTKPITRTQVGMGFVDTNLPLTIPANASLLISRRYFALFGGQPHGFSIKMNGMTVKSIVIFVLLDRHSRFHGNDGVGKMQI